VALGGCVAIGLLAPRVGRLVTPVAAAAVGAFYLAVLAITREVGAADVTIVRALLLRRGAKSG
jgi:hypothetical protein